MKGVWRMGGGGGMRPVCGDGRGWRRWRGVGWGGVTWRGEWAGEEEGRHSFNHGGTSHRLHLLTRFVCPRLFIHRGKSISRAQSQRDVQQERTQLAQIPPPSSPFFNNCVFVSGDIAQRFAFHIFLTSGSLFPIFSNRRQFISRFSNQRQFISHFSNQRQFISHFF